MSNESNLVIKKLIQKVLERLLKKEEYLIFTDSNVFFVFGSKHKNAMCDYVYGIKIKSKSPNKDNFLISKFQSDIKTNMKRIADVTVCCTDLIYEN